MSHARPLFSVVVPMFRTAAYLGALLQSFDRQRPGEYDCEFIFVDDGSDDDSAGIAQAWLGRTSAAGTVLRQENTGVATARNRGIEAATGSWITFPDSDDFLSDGYFDEAARTLRGAGPDVSVLSANVQRFQEGTNQKFDDHPLRFKFRSGSAAVDLRQHPDYIQTQTASAFFRLDLIRDHGIRFVDGLRVAEDAVFASEYLLAAPAPVLAPMRDAIYYYRRRAAANSAADTYRTNPDFYFGRFERGYLPLLDRARATGAVPRWLQNIILYDLSWFFPREMNLERKATHLSDDQRRRVVELLRAMLGQLDELAIIDYRVTRMSAEIRALLLTLAGRPLPDHGTVRMSKNVPGAFEFSYLFQGTPPTETFLSGGRPVTPLAAKTRRMDYFGQDLLLERIVRLPELPAVRVVLDGKPQPLQYGPYYLGSSEATASRARATAGAPPEPGTPVWKQAAIRAAAELVCWTKAPIRKPGISQRGAALRGRRYREFIRNMAATPHFRHKYGRAWLVMDKIGAGGDNGEYFYDYLTAERPDVNAWFVLRKDAPDWNRLEQKGFRLIAYRSIEHKVALQLAHLVASSQLDVEVVEPVAPNYYPRSRRPWRFVYLQHGVLQHNLAHWFNTKDIDLLTTASVDEHDSIVADGGTYRLTSDAVVMTGFPRHDVIARLAERHPYGERRVILVAPTWRNDLFLPKAAFGARRMLREPFLDTEYGQNWMALLSHPALRRLAAEAGAEVVFLPHPNLRGNMPGVVFPPHVTVIESTPDIHELMSRSRVTVTDYSSIFFDAALAHSRVVYFQFDQERFLNGGHTYLPGYWDYAEHGFGPIGTHVDEAADLISGAYTAEASAWPPIYDQRLARTLPLVDGGSAKRIADIIDAKFGR